MPHLATPLTVSLPPCMCRCLLDALSCLHKAGYGHGDLARRDVLSITEHNFMLIDLESVLKLGTPPDPMPAEGPMAAAVEEDGTLTARSDLYMLGSMLKDDVGAGQGRSICPSRAGNQPTTGGG
jgi:hypothetical protein